MTTPFSLMRFYKYAVATLVLLLQVVVSFSQLLKFSGKVESYHLAAGDKIYYSFNGEKSSSHRFITCDKSLQYHFSVKLDEVKKRNLTELVFSADTLQKAGDPQACVQVVAIGKMLQLPGFKNKTSFDVRNDLMLDINCEEGIMISAKQDGKFRFTGTYLFKVNDTIHNVELNDVLYDYYGTLPGDTYLGIKHEFGSWSYDDATGLLTIFIRYMENPELGLRKIVERQFDFAVKEVSSVLHFTNSDKKVTLEKL